MSATDMKPAAAPHSQTAIGRQLRESYRTALTHRRMGRGDPAAPGIPAARAAQDEAAQHDRAGRPGIRRRSNALADLLNPVVRRQPNASDSDVWTSLAAHVLAHGLDPARCIRDALALVGDGDREPRPDELIGLMNSPQFPRASEIIHERLAIQLHSQYHAARAAVRQAMSLNDRTPAEARAEVLSSTQWPLTPLFRFCVAAKLRGVAFADLARRWHRAARMQYDVDPEAYDGAWACFHPGEVLSAPSMSASRPSLAEPWSLPAMADCLPPLPRDSAKGASLRGAAAGTVSTGIPFLDELLGGGHAPGQVYALMGPYGSCKTTLAVMHAVEAARAMDMQECATADVTLPGSAFFVSFEARESEVRTRARSFAAMVDRGGLENGSIRGDEERRLRQAGHILARRLAIITPRPEEDQGDRRDPWAELATRIEEHCEVHRCRCGFVVVDYVGAMARMWASDHDRHVAAIREFLDSAAEQVRSRIARRFACPVWLIHQLSGDANQRPAWARLDGRDAAGSQHFTDGCDAAVILGKQASDRRCIARVTLRQRELSTSSAVIRVDGAFGRVVAAGPGGVM